ncbi:MAG: exosome complex RNA-binding protein Csl4 [Nitrososphaerota archaeon]|nr:exosome complex RNA-binding protein Csl4 [Candidatus Bathyarchaeota archaeon]MDW8048089.1 exosome complex RNA-binding protein Csl4 [Nitrososphaerota archaeon]
MAVKQLGRESGYFVTPGEKIGVIEEFIPYSGTQVDNGIIRSTNVGFVLLDFANRRISVYPTARNHNIPKVGSIVIGEVTGVQSSMAFVRISKVGRKFISGSFTGVLHISDVSFRYAENILDCFRLGDVIRAKVISNKNRTFHLTTKGDNLGVIFALCSQCGGPLVLKGKILRCESCNTSEKRKIANDYGTVSM